MIFGVLVSYNPNITDLEKNLISINSQLDKLIVFDNDSKNKNDLDNLCSKLSIELIKNDANIGLSAAYNYVISKYKGQFNYFVTFDQDTFLEENTISRLINLFDDKKDVGIVGPSYNNNILHKNAVSSVSYLIQSCSVFRSELFDKVGPFNDALFIDSVDFEYCLRVLSSGYKILKANNIHIEHHLGETKSRYGIKYIEHNASRNYFIARNHKYLTKKYIKQFPYFILKKNFFFFIHILKLIFLDQDYDKITNTIKGLKENI